jgi:glucose/mannose transport system substrate-binding protein
MHWWTSSSESAAVRKFADAYRAAGVWGDTAIAGADQAKAVAINRIVGGNPPLPRSSTPPSNSAT